MDCGEKGIPSLQRSLHSECSLLVDGVADSLQGPLCMRNLITCCRIAEAMAWHTIACCGIH
eukprot:m.265533 g.265533  ORF g.265533 m.265533 type:complete len:61 (-) comp29756_c0_seq1:93-275(-)